ncbi:hypothetical protein BJN42_26620 [Pseudomonas koreensis]|uniref:hypothetical protein n=1 Tax=Pseudomonas sp. GXM4 TaxID=2651867 RepID=UPI0008AE965D|nr:hypothetical protein [Pseudomonas sp. GXM4]KAB2524859.1 virion morphogenesis protein [Pseudomonas sp. GXM4]OFJ42663.1 hypothetical protein BJN42_26620 [Pseudomonas koreensis]
MTALTFSLDIRGLLDASERLQLLSLPPAKRRRVLSKSGDRFAAHNRSRLRSQRNLDRSAFAPRKDGHKRRMLRGVAKTLRRTQTSATHAVVGWRRSAASRIASEHQHGRSQVMTAARMRGLYQSSPYAGAATRKQAKALLRAGYRVRVQHRWRRPTQSWIVQNLSSGQAGLILARLEGRHKPQRWTIRLPVRHALGADAHTIRDLIKTVLQQTINAPR